MPFGGLVAGLLVSGYGEVAALLVVGAAYTVATMSPLLVPSFRRFDERPVVGAQRAAEPAAEDVSAETGEPERDLTRG